MTEAEKAVVAQALAILEAQFKKTQVFESPADVRAYLQCQLAGLEREVFGVLFLNAQHALIDFEIMFRGTLSQTSVYPREIAKRALQLNAASVILTHNHPSGDTTPSRADEALTSTLKSTLSLFDIRVLDHIIVGKGALSMAEKGLM